MGTDLFVIMKLLHTVPFGLLASGVLAGDGCNGSDRHCVCYDDIGECYSENSPWGGTSQRPLKSLPDSPSQIKPEFRLYTKSNKNSYDLLEKGAKVPSHFSSSKTTIFLIHGFISSGEDKGWMGTMKDSFLASYDFNVVLLDWSNGANVGTFNLDYPKASQNTRVVGDMLAQLVDYLHDDAGLKGSDVHCIGHSLGSHVCGYGGKAVGRSAGSFSRISCLDPAGPYFENTPDYVRLDRADAGFVDCIHTDGVPLYEAGFGMMQAIGDADYYPNGGVDQPGCRTIAVGCSHGRSHEYYASSITASCVMEGHACSSYESWQGGSCDSCGSNKCGEMGWHADKNTKHQSYYLDTKSRSPWCT